MHETFIKQCYSLPKGKGKIHQTTRCMMITGYKSRYLMTDEGCMLLHGSSDVVSKVCFRIVHYLNSWITRKYFFLFFLDRKRVFYSSLTNKQCKFTMRSIYNTYQWGRKACLLYHWKRNKIINRPLGNKRIGKKIRFWVLYLRTCLLSWVPP